MKTLNIKCLTLIAGLSSIIVCGQAYAETAIDASKPLMLRSIMQDLGKEMQVITDGISREEWAQVEKAAAKIADHPRPPLTERMQIMSFIGDDASKFKSTDKKTHDAARTLRDAATQKNGQTVISAFAALQNACLTCHQQFRKTIRDHFDNQQ